MIFGNFSELFLRSDVFALLLHSTRNDLHHVFNYKRQHIKLLIRI